MFNQLTNAFVSINTFYRIGPNATTFPVTMTLIRTKNHMFEKLILRKKMYTMCTIF